jgi:hypothetical protein
MMAMTWFRLDNTANLDRTDLSILNRAMRHLVNDHNLSPTHYALSLVRQTYKPGLSAKDVIELVNDARPP